MSLEMNYKTTLTGRLDGLDVATLSRVLTPGKGDGPYVITVDGFTGRLKTKDFDLAVKAIKALTEYYSKASGEGMVDEPDRVDRLAVSERDREWIDREGDHYKVLDNEWCLKVGTGSWDPIRFPSTLTGYGPYTAVSN